VSKRATRREALLYMIKDRHNPTEHVATDWTAIWRRGERWLCTYCGHRIPTNGVPIIETRKQPWRIPSEMITRFRAMRRHQEA